MLIDSHLHLDSNTYTSISDSVASLAVELDKSDLDKVILLHLQTQPWSALDVSNAIKPYPNIKAFANIHPDQTDAISQLEHSIYDLGFIGLKLHPRLQEYPVNSSNCIRLVQHAGHLNVPVLIDAFPDGTHLMQGFNPLNYADVAVQAPQTQIIWAHMGGHKVIDFMMLAKRLPNIFMDMSYSLLYYRTSSVVMDMIYAMRSMRFKRIFYGSDYPDRGLQNSYELSKSLLASHGVEESQLDLLFGQNILDLLGHRL